MLSRRVRAVEVCSVLSRRGARTKGNIVYGFKQLMMGIKNFYR